MKKQMKYADLKKIPFVILAGESEIQSGFVFVKNMLTGEQISVGVTNLVDFIIQTVS